MPALATTSVSPNKFLVPPLRTGLVDTQPGPRLADMYVNGGYEKFVASRDMHVPIGRMGDGWDVAHVALFLASDEAQYVTDTELVVDGGLTSATR